MNGSQNGPPPSSGQATNTTQPFDQVLEKGASVDSMFKDTPTPKGSDPFEVQPLVVEEVQQADPIRLVLAEENAPVAESLATEGPAIAVDDQDTLFCINRKFAALEAIFNLVTKACSFTEMIQQIIDISVEQVKSETGSFIEIDYQKNIMFFRAISGRSSPQSKNLFSITIPRGQGVVGFVCENQQTMALSRVDETSIYLSKISDSVGFETNNLIAVPVTIRGATFGCIELLNRVGEEKYTDADKEVLAAVSKYAARVIENRLNMAALTQAKEEKQAA